MLRIKAFFLGFSEKYHGVAVAGLLVLAGIFFAAPVQAQLKECNEGYWGIDTVTTASPIDEYGPFPSSGMGLHLERVDEDFWVGTFYLDDGWYTFELDDEGGGDLRETAFSEPFLGVTRTISTDSVYLLPQEGLAGFARPAPIENGPWGCMLSDACFREFEITQLTFPKGACD